MKQQFKFGKEEALEALREKLGTNRLRKIGRKFEKRGNTKNRVLKFLVEKCLKLGL